MDLALTIVFFICAILAVAGAVGAALGPAASWRLLGLLALAVGTAGVLASFSAVLAALVALVCLGASAVLLASAGTTPVHVDALRGEAALPAQVGAAAAAILLVILLVVALAGTFAQGGASTGFDLAALGRALFGRDALAVEAVGATLTAALAIGAATRSRRP